MNILYQAKLKRQLATAAFISPLVLLTGCLNTDLNFAYDKDGITPPPPIPTVAPVLTEITPVATPSSNIQPVYTFHSDQAGSLTYSGACSSDTLNAVAGNNEITFHVLPRGKTYSDCALTVTNSGNLSSNSLAIPAFDIRYTVNDTGITKCGDYAYGGSGTHNNALDCASLPVEATATQEGQDANGDPVPAGQDAHFGRDATANLAKIGTGPAGFDYTKLGADGQPLAIQNAAWDDNGAEANGTRWSCVQDNVTGLIWEVKTSEAGLHNKGNTYTWYSTTNNNGSAGTQNGGSCSGSDCDTQAFTQAVNAEKLCGFSDWRMPSSEELAQLVHHGRYSPAISTELFPNTRSSWYWSSSPFAYNSNYAWLVYFYFGNEDFNYKNSSHYVRLVRAGQ